MEHTDNPEVLRMLARKLNPPLVTLLSSEPEVQYVALSAPSQCPFDR